MCTWRIADALSGFLSDANRVVSSAKVAIVVKDDTGKSAVKIRYNIGPRTIPCGTSDCIGDKSVYSS